MKTDRIWRALSVALALCLTLALAPTCAFAADADTEPVEDGVSTSGVTDVTGGSGVTVKTEVRNNYTDTYERQTVTLVNGTATVEDDFSGLDGRNLTFADLGVLTLQAAYDGGSKKTTFTVDTSKVQRQKEGQQYTAAEVEDLQKKLAALAAAAEEQIDWPRLLALCEKEPPALSGQAETPPARVRIAVAQDEAFCFTYAESLDMLRRCGAQLLPFRPLDDRALPEGACALYLPGGYPELYARSLAENEAGRCAVAAAVTGGMPTVAECGGFLYLGPALQGTDGQWYPMAGVLPGKAERKEGLVRFGYARLAAEKESLLLRAGERVPVHEFHHWDSTENGVDLGVEKPLTGRTWRCGFTTDTLYAAFPHLYFAGHPALAQRFVAAARRYSAKKEKQT